MGFSSGFWHPWWVPIAKYDNLARSDLKLRNIGGAMAKVPPAGELTGIGPAGSGKQGSALYEQIQPGLAFLLLRSLP
jgi:hypothetical protein